MEERFHEKEEEQEVCPAHALAEEEEHYERRFGEAGHSGHKLGKFGHRPGQNSGRKLEHSGPVCLEAGGCFGMTMELFPGEPLRVEEATASF